MTLDPLIKKAKIAEVINRKYFTLQEQLFWLFARQTDANKIDNESYSVHVNADNNFPDTRYNFTRTLPKYIAGDIEEKFEGLKEELNRFLITLPSEPAQNSFIALIIIQLGELRSELKFIEAPDSYNELIQSEFDSHIADISKNFQKKSKKNKINSRDWTIRYPQLRTPSGNEKFKALHDKLVEHNLLDESTSYQGFKKFFNNGTPTDKLIWKGTLSELVTFLRELNASPYVEVDNHFNALKECFIFSKGRIYSLKNLNGDKGTQNSKKQDLIENIVKHLN